MRPWTIAIWASVGLALAAGYHDGRRAIHSSGWGRFVYEFTPKPDGSPTDYIVYALTRNPQVGVQMRPHNMEDRPVSTASRIVSLDPRETSEARVRYSSQRVAYLEVHLDVIRVEQGSLLRGGQEVLSVRNDRRWSFLWGLAWVGTFGLVALVDMDLGSNSGVYTEAVPLDAPPFQLRIAGGGGCLALGGADRRLTVYPSALQAGRVYVVRARLRCANVAGGNYAEFGLGVHEHLGLRAFLDGQLIRLHGLPQWAYSRPGYTYVIPAFDREELPLGDQLPPPPQSHPVVLNPKHCATVGAGEDRDDVCSGLNYAGTPPPHPVLGRTMLAYVYPIDGTAGYTAEPRLLQVEEAGPEEITPDLSYIAEGVETVEGEQEVEGRRTRYSYLRFAKRAATPIRDYTLRYRTVARCSMSPSGDEAFFYYTCGPYQLGVRDGEIFWQ